MHPFYYRDAVRQGVVDLMSRRLAPARRLVGLADLDPALDNVKPSGESVAFVGIDLGAEIGATLSSYEPSVGALVLAFAGGLTVDGWIDSPRTPGLTDALFARLGHATDAVDFATDSLDGRTSTPGARWPIARARSRMRPRCSACRAAC